MPRALRLAHRGDWRHGPENSLAAIRGALANPACDGLEFDVRGSRDGIPILLHDATLARVQGRPERVVDLDADELAVAGIPSLAAVLSVAGPGPFLDVELKGEPVPEVIPVLEASRGPALNRAVVSSFDPATLAWMRTQRPGWPSWLNADVLDSERIKVAVELGCLGISVDWHAIDERAVNQAGAAGLAVAAWTVRRRATVTRLERLGVLAVCVEAAALDPR